MSPKAIIIGGGIGGLSAAICLRMIGWQVQVLEQAPEISEVGAGVQISPVDLNITRAPAMHSGFFHGQAKQFSARYAHSNFNGVWLKKAGV